MGGLKLNVLLSSFVIGLKGSIFDILCFIIALFFLHRVLKFIDLYLSRQAGKFVSFSLSVLKFGVVLGGGGGGRGGRGGAADRDGGGVLVGDWSGDGGGVLVGDGGGYLCRVTGKFVSFSLSVLKFGVVRGDGGSNNEKDAGGGG